MRFVIPHHSRDSGEYKIHPNAIYLRRQTTAGLIFRRAFENDKRKRNDREKYKKKMRIYIDTKPKWFYLSESVNRVFRFDNLRTIFSFDIVDWWPI